MSLFLPTPKIAAGLAEGAQTGPYWRALRERTRRHTREPSLLQPDDTQEWWHLVWERISDAAFVQAVEPDDQLSVWLRDRILEMVRLPLDEWIGPWFRERTDPRRGHLETAHAALAVATTLDLCGEIFTKQEGEEIRQALRTKGMDLCRVWLDERLADRRLMNNWTMVLLNGYGTAAAVLDDRDAVERAIRDYAVLVDLYNRDSYGESLQYWNYAAIHHTHLNEVIRRYDPELGSTLDIGCYTRCIPWVAAGHLYMKPLEGWGEKAYPRGINFGDSAAIFRPTADVLLHIAARARAEYPRQAGLARWLFDRCYAEPDLGPWERASFGFFNQFQFLTPLLLDAAAVALSPEKAGLPLLARSEVGNIVIRDSWREPRTVLAAQAGYETLMVSSHRHGDQNSFQLLHLGERFFVDPGHCCYRLATQGLSKSTAAHSTWRMHVDEEIRDQEGVSGNAFDPKAVLNRLVAADTRDDITVVCSDAAEAYGSPVTRAERTWILAGPHCLFIVDRIEASDPVGLETRFVLNNRDNRLRVNVAASDRLVLRRGQAAMKFFLLTNDDIPMVLSRSWGYVHDCYHPLPNQRGQGREGSAVTFAYLSTEPRTHFTIVYALAMDEEEKIRKWHIRKLDGDRYHVEPPGGEGGAILSPGSEGEMILEYLETGAAYRITPEGLSRPLDDQR